MASVELNHVNKVDEGNVQAINALNLQISDRSFVVLVWKDHDANQLASS